MDATEADQDHAVTGLGSTLADIAAAAGASGVVFAVAAGDDGPLLLAATFGYEVGVVDQWRVLSSATSVPLTEAWRSQEPVFCGRWTEATRRFPDQATGPGAGNEAIAAIPLPTSDGSVDAVVGFSFPTAQDFDEGHRRRLCELTAEARPALERHVGPAPPGFDERARLMAALESSVAMSVLSGDVGTEGVEEVVCREATRQLGCDRAILWAVGRHEVEVVVAHPPLAPDEDGLIEGVPRVAALIADGTTHFCSASQVGPGSDPQEREMLARLGAGSALLVPVSLPGALRGRLCFAWNAPRSAPSAVELFTGHQLARAASAALRRASEHAELVRVEADLEAIGRAVQPPGRLPQPPGCRVASWFEPVDGDFGGDFFDVFELRGRSYGVILGDVAGHGAPAASVTALARHVARGAALAGRAPAQVVQLVNSALWDAGESCTLVVGQLVWGAGARRLGIARGGHPHPLVRRRDGAVASTGAEGAMLGAFPHITVTEEVVVLDPGDVVVLYTDGVTDTRGPMGEFETDRLRAAISAAAPPTAQGVIDGVRRALDQWGPGSTRDDRAIVTLEVVAS